MGINFEFCMIPGSVDGGSSDGKGWNEAKL